jgi:hypothetical protein
MKGKTKDKKKEFEKKERGNHTTILFPITPYVLPPQTSSIITRKISH